MRHIGLSLAILAFLSDGGSPVQGQSLSNPVLDKSPQAIRLPVEPLGASRCQVCHSSEVEGYARSAMAHSLRRADQEPNGAVSTRETKIDIHSSPSGYWQRLESAGEIQNYRIDYVIGSGNHASGYLLDLAGHLFQSPVAYYKSRHAYDLAPGYEGLPNPDFTRPIAEGCLFCHSGSALKVPGTLNEYRSPAFSAEAISCERCHGSAERHLKDPRAGTIVNPAKLERAARDSICEQCHLLGVGRVLNPGKVFNDFAPGQRLEDVFTTYRYVSESGVGAEKFKVISHVEQLARSTCARSSNGRLWCGTCHDPHSKPLQPVSYFRSKCLSCHTGNFPGSHPNKESNCIGCHMPRRDAKDGGHTAFTDHRIQRRPEAEPALPADSDIAAWREPASEFQKRNLGIAYVNAGVEHRSPQFLIRGYRLLTEIQNEFRFDDEVFTAIGTALLMGKQDSEAELAFERALQLSPNSVTAETNAASAYLQAGSIGKATTHLERAVALDPMYLPAAAPLIELYRRQGEKDKADALTSEVRAARGTQAAPVDHPENLMAERSGQTAEKTFKNIQVLKDAPAEELIPAMRFIAESLGVECSYCHVQDHFDKDDKKPKQIARNMMRMMFAIDKSDFAGERQVTCYSCHRGSLKPQAIPAVDDHSRMQTAESREEILPANSATADQLIERYIDALGGASAIEAVTSRRELGTSKLEGRTVSIEILDQDPNKQVSVWHGQAGDRIAAFDGSQGWTSTPGSSIREMHGAELTDARMDADLRFPLHIRQLFGEVRVEYPETVGDHEAFVVSCRNVGQPPLKLYFDEQSGLLVRLVRYSISPLGLLPTQIDYADYRDVDGVKTPFQWTIAQWNGSSSVQLDQVEQNVLIDTEKFAKPRSSGESNPSGQK